MRLRSHLFGCVLQLFVCSVPASAQELRGLWADAFNNGFRTPAQVTQMIADARAAKVNALFVQVRKRGDAFYNSAFEPKADQVSPASYDPLADLIAKANTGGPKIEIHAWIVTFNIWNSQNGTPSSPLHPYRAHPDWLTERNDGVKFDGANYALDQGHPEVQKHTFNVCQDILSRYAVDGLHFDYIRYTDADSSGGNQPWGYNPVTVARFQKLSGTTARPAPTNAQWLQFRRDQVTALVRKVYLHGWKIRPSARISAALICYGSAPTANTAAAFQVRDAYSRVLQDWREWMREGILDLSVPMIYRDNSLASSRTQFINWSNWTRDNAFNRAGAAGMGIYLSPVEGTIDQIKLSRAPAAGSGRTLAGQVGYSYANWCRRSNGAGGFETNYITRSAFYNALTQDAAAEVYDPGGSPVYGAAAAVPAMTWKTGAVTGHLMGFAVNGADGTDFDGAEVRISGAVTRTVKTDGTGFFGTLDLPAGTYTVTMRVPGHGLQSRSVTVTGSRVAETARQDIEQGKQDTGKGPELGATYDRLRKSTPDPDKKFSP